MTPAQRRTMLAARLSVQLPPREVVEPPADDGAQPVTRAVERTPAEVSALLGLDQASEAKLSGLERMVAEAESFGGREEMVAALGRAGHADVAGKPLAWLVTRMRALGMREAAGA